MNQFISARLCSLRPLIIPFLILLCACAAPAQNLPDAPAPRAPRTAWTSKWTAIAWMAASDAAMVYDYEKTLACMRRHTCAEGNPLLGKHPSRGLMYGVTVPVHALAHWLTWSLRKDALSGDTADNRNNRRWYPIGDWLCLAGHAAARLAVTRRNR